MSNVHTLTETNTTPSLIIRGGASHDETPPHTGPPAMDTDTDQEHVATGQAGDVQTDNEDNATSFNSEVEKLEPSQPPEPAVIKGANIPCRQKAELPKPSTAIPNTNKNASPGINVSESEKPVSKTSNKNACPGKPVHENTSQNMDPGSSVNESSSKMVDERKSACQSSNKNALPRKSTCSNSTDNANITVLATQMSQLEIDGPQVPELGRPVSASDSPEPQTSTSSSLAASTSSTSMASSASSVGAEDDLEYGDVSPSSMPTSCSESNLQVETGSTKEDFVILHTEEDAKDAKDFKMNFEKIAKERGFKDPKVKLFSCIGYGSSVFCSIENVPNEFKHTLIYVTENLCKDHKTKYDNEMLIELNLEIGPNCRVTPIRATKAKQPIPELKILKGLPYWRIKTGSDPEMYMDAVESIWRQIRKQ